MLSIEKSISNRYTWVSMLCFLKRLKSLVLHSPNKKLLRCQKFVYSHTILPRRVTYFSIHFCREMHNRCCHSEITFVCTVCSAWGDQQYVSICTGCLWKQSNWTQMFEKKLYWKYFVRWVQFLLSTPYSIICYANFQTILWVRSMHNAIEIIFIEKNREIT